MAEGLGWLAGQTGCEELILSHPADPSREEAEEERAENGGGGGQLGPPEDAKWASIRQTAGQRTIFAGHSFRSAGSSRNQPLACMAGACSSRRKWATRRPLGSAREGGK